MGRKVFQVVASLAQGGAERIAIELAARLPVHGWETSLVSFGGQSGQDLRAAAIGRGVEVADLPAPSLRRPQTLWQIRSFLANADVDLVHVHNRPVDWQVVALARLARVPVLYTRHLVYQVGSQRQRLLYSLAARAARVVVTVSEGVAANLRDNENAPPDKIRVIYNGIDSHAFRLPTAGERDAKRAELDVGPDEFLWLVTARLHEQKGLMFLLDALARLPDDSRSRVLLAGDGPELDSLRSQATALELGSRIEFLGRRGDVPELLWAADGYVCSSLSEGQPLALLEAMAAGVVVIAPRLGVIDEIATNGVPRFYGPQHSGWATGHDPAHIATAMLEFERAASRPDAETLRRHVVERFSMEAMVDAHHDLYSELLGSP